MSAEAGPPAAPAPDDHRGGAPERTIDGRAGVAILIATMVANLSNYGFQVLTGRVLSVESYGLLAGFMSVVTIITVATSSLQATAARSIAAHEHRPDDHPRLDAFTRSAIIAAGIGGLMICVLSPLLASALQVGTVPVILLGIYVLPSALDSIAAGRLQGLHRFRGMAIYSTGQAVAKLGVATVFLIVGAKAGGLLAGLVLSCAGVAIVGLTRSREAGAIDVHAAGSEARRGFVALTLFWVALSVDVLLARATFPPRLAGVYAAAAVLGKAVLWLPATVTQIAFPRLARSAARGEHAPSILAKSLVAVGGTSLVATVGLWILGDPIFAILYGDRYVGAGDIAWKIGLAMVPFGVINMLVFDNLAKQRGRFILWMVAGVGAEVVALCVVPRSPLAYAVVMGSTGVMLALAMLSERAWGRVRAARTVAPTISPPPPQ